VTGPPRGARRRVVDTVERPFHHPVVAPALALDVHTFDDPFEHVDRILLSF